MYEKGILLQHQITMYTFAMLNTHNHHLHINKTKCCNLDEEKTSESWRRNDANETIKRETGK